MDNVQKEDFFWAFLYRFIGSVVTVMVVTVTVVTVTEVTVTVVTVT